VSESLWELLSDGIGDEVQVCVGVGGGVMVLDALKDTSTVCVIVKVKESSVFVPRRLGDAEWDSSKVRVTDVDRCIVMDSEADAAVLCVGVGGGVIVRVTVNSLLKLFVLDIDPVDRGIEAVMVAVRDLEAVRDGVRVSDPVCDPSFVAVLEKVWLGVGGGVMVSVFVTERSADLVLVCVLVPMRELVRLPSLVNVAVRLSSAEKLTDFDTCSERVGVGGGVIVSVKLIVDEREPDVSPESETLSVDVRSCTVRDNVPDASVDAVAELVIVECCAESVEVKLPEMVTECVKERTAAVDDSVFDNEIDADTVAESVAEWSLVRFCEADALW